MRVLEIKILLCRINPFDNFVVSCFVKHSPGCCTVYAILSRLCVILFSV